MTRKTSFYEGWSWFKFNNLELALYIVLKFSTSVEKGPKIKVRKFWERVPTFVEVTGERLVGYCGIAIEEFVGLKPKMHSFLVGDNSEHKKAKEVNEMLLQQ